MKKQFDKTRIQPGHILRQYLLQNSASTTSIQDSTSLRKLSNSFSTKPLPTQSLSYTAAVKRIPKRFVCIYCDKSFVKASDLDRHIRTHTFERNFKCTEEDCAKSFKLKITLQRHLTTHERKTSFTCSICTSNYKSQKVLENHMTKVHSRRQTFHVHKTELKHSHDDITANEELTDNKLDSLGDLLCDASERRSPHNSSPVEINHENEETVKIEDEVIVPLPRKELICDACGKCFKKPIDLRRHNDAVHRKQRPFVCHVELCGKSFSLKCTLNRHMETHSTDRQRMKCDICSKVLAAKCSLNLHKRIHDDLKPVKCQECTASFRTPGNLQSHLKTHKRRSDSMSKTKCDFMVS